MGQQGADYILAVKDNKQELKAQVKKLFGYYTALEKDETVDCGHGRVEARVCETIGDLRFMDGKEDWPGPKSIVRITSVRYIKKTGEESTETRYYITSHKSDPKKLNKGIRSHWTI